MSSQPSLSRVGPWGVESQGEGDLGGGVEKGRRDGNPSLPGGRQTGFRLGREGVPTLALRILQCKEQEAWS